MHTRLDCYPCFLRQTLSAARRAGATAEMQQRLLLQTMDHLRDFAPDTSPPQMASVIHRMVRHATNSADPYRLAKEESTTRALALYPHMKEIVAGAADPFEAAVRVTLAGNIIDFGVAEHYALEKTLQEVLEKPFAINDLEILRAALATSPWILYLADNAGETVFDRVWIEHIGKSVTYAVKAAPALNDATREDAEAAGLLACVELIDNGTDSVGTLLARCSELFRERFDAAPLIIAKGQANYESLSQVEAPIVFLLQAKCPVIAGDLSVPTGSLIIHAPFLQPDPAAHEANG